MKRATLFIFLFCNAWFCAVSQPPFGDQVPQLKRYNPTDIIDPEYGIEIYNNLIFNLGGDSVRYGKKGYNVQGWMEDFYVDGSILHKGFYEDGQLKAFKNFYPNGVLERSFRIMDMKHCEMVCYYQSGKVKSEIIYYESNTQKQTDYFPSGVISYAEENEKNNEFLYKRNSYKEDGSPVIIFEITDKKKRLYLHKEFHENGKVKEEGGMKFTAGDYVKEGPWTFYDENGNVTKKEKYHNGSLTD
ncbi:MAG: morn variant repeat-containing protein [Bacteroidetes bacterium]|nr:morn variant repeat-containing protein [Bacteroidota bacterium]